LQYNYRDTNRAVRLTQIQHFLHQHSQGLTCQELSQMCNVTIRTIQRDLLMLQSDLHIPITNKSNDRYGILKDYVLPPVAYTLYEALVLFLAVRLLIRQTDESNPHTQSAINKLISIMPKPLAIQLKQSIASIGQRPVNPDELNIFETISLAWVTQKRLRIIYDSFHRKKTEEWFVNPYFIEMTGIGYSVYLIGYAESGEKMGIYTFKLNRIKEAETLDEDFEISREIKMDELLASSWGIIWGENIQVKLKFSPEVTRRVKESNWHPSQNIVDLPEGGCILTMKVSSTLEMTPWIRGWGPDVEVLEPPELREQMRGWAERLREMYKGG
jgi:predicted DNA-binding transcriptional regulator YafY